jgi:hypothetical protein
MFQKTASFTIAASENVPEDSGLRAYKQLKLFSQRDMHSL